MSVLMDMMNDGSKEMKIAKTMVMDINDIEPNELNNAPMFGVEELSEYIKQDGLHEKIIVYKVSNHQYKILSGERRWRACKLAGFETIEVIIQDKPESYGLELLSIDASNETREQNEEFLNSRIQLLSKAYEELKKEGQIKTGVLKRDWIALRMNGTLKARQIQNYLSGNVKSIQEVEDVKTKNDKPKDITKEIDKRLKQLSKIYDYILENEEDMTEEQLHKFKIWLTDYSNLF